MARSLRCPILTILWFVITSMKGNSAKLQCPQPDSLARYLASRPDQPRTPVVVMVGLEGSGHHLVESILDAMELQHHPYTPEVMIDKWDFETKYMQWLDGERFTNKEGVKYMIHSEDAFPEGRQRECMETKSPRRPSVLRHPDLGKLACLDSAGLIDLRLVYLRRPFADCICSSLRRFPGYPLDNTAIAVEALMYIDRILSHPDIDFEPLDYNRALAAPMSMANALNYALRGIVDGGYVPTWLERHVHLKEEPPAEGSSGHFECPERSYIEHTLQVYSLFLDPLMLPTKSNESHPGQLTITNFGDVKEPKAYN